VGDLAAEMYQEKHVPLPALTVVQVGALPLEGAQVEIEATEVERKAVNPAGVVFLGAEPGASVAESLGKLKNALSGQGVQSSEALLVTCFVSSLEEQRDAARSMSAAFPGAALDYVQMQRAPVMPAASCETVARASKPGGPAEVVISGTQLAFGSQESDFKLALGRMEKAVAAKGARLDRAILAHLYVTSGAIGGRVAALLPGGGARSVIPVEALPSLDSAFGLEIVAPLP
jgi:hypothetical protein